jgi:hypothetical protein
MQGPHTTPTEDDEASIPTEHVRNGPNLNRTFTVRRKAAKRTLPWKVTADEIQLALSPLQDEDIRETKRRRLEEPLDEAATNTTPHTTAVALPSSDATADHTDSDPVTETQPNARTTGATGHFTLVEDAKLTSAVTNTRKKKQSKNWVAIAALVPGRTQIQCRSRWHGTLYPSIGQTTARSGKWTEDEDMKLKNAVQKHGGKDWVAIATLVPGRTTKQCWNRWHDVLDPSIDRVTGCMGKWEEEEDIKLKNAVHKLGSKNWVAIAALVPGRTKIQCKNRWYGTLNPSIDRVTERTGKWKEVEDIKLKDAVRKLGSKNWVAIAALVPGRTKKQCSNRWRNALNPRIALTTGSTGAWTTGEIIKLKAAVQTYGGKDWVAIAALVPGRTKKQCWNRWRTHGSQP